MRLMETMRPMMTTMRMLLWMMKKMESQRMIRQLNQITPLLDVQLFRKALKSHQN